MNQKNAPHLHAQWEHAVERALEEQARSLEFSAEDLTDAAGLRVKAGVKGGWNSFGSCGTCTCHGKMQGC